MDRQSISEVCAGLVLTEQKDPNAFNLKYLAHPYGEIVRAARDGKDETWMMMKFGHAPVQSALTAAKGLNGTAQRIDWSDALRIAYIRAEAGGRLKKPVDKLIHGEDVDVNELRTAIALLDTEREPIATAADIEAVKVVWAKSDYKPFDLILGGYAKSALTTIGGFPGTGKTTLLARLAANRARAGGKVLVFSMDVKPDEFVYRMDQVAPLPKAKKKNILLVGDIGGVGEVYATASKEAATDDISLILIDYMDMMIQGEANEGKVEEIYRTLKILANRTEISIAMGAQFNFEAYKLGIPRVNHLRHSRMAEAHSAVILLIFNAFKIWATTVEDKRLRAVEGTAYIIVGKSRWGTRKGGIGGIQIGFDGKKGWGNEVLGWFPLDS